MISQTNSKILNETWEWSSILNKLCCYCEFWLVNQSSHPWQWILNLMRTCVISILRREGDIWMCLIIKRLYESDYSGCVNCLLKNWMKANETDCDGSSIVSHASCEWLPRQYMFFVCISVQSMVYVEPKLS